MPDRLLPLPIVIKGVPAVPDLQILSIVRFAYPGLGMFQVEHDSVAARQDYLWAPDRMEARLRNLEHVCIRTLAMQSDPHFRTLILTGDALPDPYRSRLLAIAARLPGAEVVFHPPQQQKHALSEVITPRVDPNGPPVLYFRQDDDDGVAISFIARCRQIFADTRGLWDRHGRLCIDFNRGLRVTFSAHGPRVQRLFEANIGVAQAIILRPDNKRSGMHFAHHRMPTLMPTLSIPDQFMWLRGLDHTNDSRANSQMHRLTPATPEDIDMLQTRFKLDLDALQGSF